jgi:hypothetical protein
MSENCVCERMSAKNKERGSAKLKSEKERESASSETKISARQALLFYYYTEILTREILFLRKLQCFYFILLQTVPPCAVNCHSKIYYYIGGKSLEEDKKEYHAIILPLISHFKG